jgi:2-isopropylmalate synthase
MAAFGVHYAEIGFAGANQFVSDLTAALGSHDTGAMKLALFGRTRGSGAKVREWPDVQFIISHKQRVPVAVLVAKSRLLDVQMSLETTPEENLLMAYETVACLQDSGLEVIVDLEHAMDACCGRRESGNPCDADFGQQSLDYFHQMVEQCVRQRVSRIVVCDTTGGASSRRSRSGDRRSHAALSQAGFGFHGHTDRGLGVANSRAAILAGASQIQGTLLGTGERCGNVNLTTVIGGMQLRGEAEFVSPDSLAGLPAWRTRPTRPFAGAAARRSHRRPRRVWHMGRHAWQQRAQESRRLSLVRSRPRRRHPVIGVNAQSGRANIVLLSQSLGVPLDSAQAQVFMDNPTRP